MGKFSLIPLGISLIMGFIEMAASVRNNKLPNLFYITGLVLFLIAMGLVFGGMLRGEVYE